ncbi:HAD family hydrolase [Clostridium sp. C2-6-12]|uniref:HAD family hydrolase n=1 Tax=Clostridium sp. C2-6-12 TaxID=2698832 RepID=UPI00136EBF4A|nr:HAD family hydrolase [Clostridium sp. C2-6-12]
MKNNIEVVFFDLFFTLITPKYNNGRNENNVLEISKEQWEECAEDNDLYLERAIGKEKNPQKIIEKIIEKSEIKASNKQIKEILELRKDRFQKSLTDVDYKILEVLLDIKKSGKRLCLISNADVIDVMYWNQSPLSNLFDDAVFSYKVGYVKPQSEIYQIGLGKMNTIPEKSVFIGDGGSDELRGAKRLGMKTILSGYFLEKERKDQAIIDFADYSIKDFREILEIINN